MATYSGVVKSTAQTLGAGVADTVTFANKRGVVEVLNRDTSTLEIYVRADGVAATVGGDGCYVCLPGQGIIVPDTTPKEQTALTSVSLISSGAAKYSVTGA